ncbi:ABC-three component system middle component 6 [Deferribacter abyssi]|uniref:ABC-three component system middle component 6 n=1 Tax=Deferribacter abyssi TaxID=213806 RepID=UPI003C176D6B
MLVPGKHTNFSQSLLGLGGYIIQKLSEPKAVDELWDEYQKDLKNNKYFFKHSFENILLAITFLYSIDVVEEKNGLIYLKIFSVEK